MTSGTATPHPARLVITLVAQLTFALLAMTICLPSMQEWPRLFGESQASVQLTFSAYVLTYGAMQLVYGPLSDRWGRKPVVMFGLVIALAGSVLAALAPNLWLLVAARALQGAGSAATMVVGRALVQDFFAGPERTRVMAFVGMTMGLVPPAATLVGGQLHVRMGWQANFVLLALLALVLLATVWRVLPAPPPPNPAHSRGWRELAGGYWRLVREPGFGWYALTLASATGAFYAFLAGAPLVLSGYGVPPDQVGWYIMAPPVAYIFGNALTSRLVRSQTDLAIMGWGQAITLAGLVVLLAVGVTGPHVPLALSLPLLLLGIGHGLLVPPTLAGTVGLVPALAGTAAALAGVMQQGGGALGGYFVGLVTHHGQVNLALMMLGWSLMGMVAWLALSRSR
ncbi:MAG: Bcr/CflA family efflux MFS transporter [Burkholderiales bacterium]|nr:Bcr/CflA family efflux MFS transporter [Burkholderiales bacterium]